VQALLELNAVRGTRTSGKKKGGHRIRRDDGEAPAGSKREWTVKREQTRRRDRTIPLVRKSQKNRKERGQGCNGLGRKGEKKPQAEVLQTAKKII